MAITVIENGFVFVPRPDWDYDADYPSASLRTPVSKVYIHHTVTNPTANPCNDARTVERVLDTRGLSGYNYLSHPDGTILELAGEKRGAHTKGQNSTSIAFSLIGNYDHLQPTMMQLVNIARCINLLRLKGVLASDLERIQILPHSAAPGAATACPGANVREPRINGRTGVEWIRWFAATGV